MNASQLAAIAQRSGMNPATLREASATVAQLASILRVTFAEAAARLDPAPPQSAAPDGDGRSARWYARLRIFSAAGELLGDTDDDKPEGAAGAALLQGLPAVAAWAGEIVLAFHPGEIAKDDAHKIFSSRIPSARVLLNRAKRSGKPPLVSWAIVYTTTSSAFRVSVDLLQCDESRSVSQRTAHAS